MESPTPPHRSGRWSIPERLQELFRRLESISTAKSAEEALALIARLLDEVEDQYSGVSRSPRPPLKFDGRRYPPQEDNIRRHSDGSLTATTKGHFIEIGPDGGILFRNKYT